MYVVLPVAAEPRNPSLPYALASIRAHTDYIPVTVGKDWGLCDHIPTVQGDDKFANTDLAMRVACAELGEPFVWSNDDVYWLRPADPVRWAIGKLEDAVGARVWQQRKRDTAAILNGRGLPTFDYEAHVPMLIHPTPMLEALGIGGEKRSVYGNLTGLPDMVRPDVKMRRPQNRPPLHEPWVSTEGDPMRWRDLAELLSRSASTSLH